LSLRLEWKFRAAKKWGEVVPSTTGGSRDRAEEQVANQIIETQYILCYNVERGSGAPDVEQRPAT
jgi:hypothetical protein